MKTISQPRKIWLIDDDPLINLINRRLCELCSFGTEITAFTSPLYALGCIEDTKNSENLLPDLIFLDFLMPKMNGMEFIKRLESIDNLIKQSKVVVLSSTELEEDVKKINSDLVIAFFSKPLSKEHLDALSDRF